MYNEQLKSILVGLKCFVLLTLKKIHTKFQKKKNVLMTESHKKCQRKAMLMDPRYSYVAKILIKKP